MNIRINIKVVFARSYKIFEVVSMSVDAIHSTSEIFKNERNHCGEPIVDNKRYTHTSSDEYL